MRSVSINGTSYSVPEPGDINYDQQLSTYLVALATAFPQLSNSTTQALGAELDLGALFGVKALYLKSSGQPNPAASGVARLTKSDSVAWRNNANTSDLLLGINASDQLIFNGGTFLSAPLASETDFGATAGIKLLYLKSRATTIAAAGLLRMAGGASADIIAWRNNANSADLPLTVSASDQLLFNGAVVNTGAAIASPTALISKTTAQAFSVQTAQTFANSTIVAYDTIDLDTDSGWSNVTNRYTVPASKGGQYLVIAQLGFNFNPDSSVGLYVAVNAAQVRANVQFQGNRDVPMSCILNVNAGDVIDLRCCNMGTSTVLTSLTTAGRNFLHIKRMA